MRISDWSSDVCSSDLLGYTHDAAAVKDLREIFCHATKCIIYRLNAGEKAKNDLAVAKYSGTRGNDLKVVVAMNADNEGRFDVTRSEARRVGKECVRTSRSRWGL